MTRVALLQLLRVVALVVSAGVISGCMGTADALAPVAASGSPTSWFWGAGGVSSSCAVSGPHWGPGGTVTIELRNSGESLALVTVRASVTSGGEVHDVSMQTMVPGHGRASRTATWGPGNPAPNERFLPTGSPPASCVISALVAT